MSYEFELFRDSEPGFYRNANRSPSPVNGRGCGPAPASAD